MKKSQEQQLETVVQSPILKPIQDRLRQASHITVQSAVRNNVSLKVSWYDVHGESQSQEYTIPAGSVIEF